MKNVLDAAPTSRRRAFAAPVLVGVATAALLTGNAVVHSPVYDECGHLAAGVRIWTRQSFGLYQVNPPLVKALAAAPAVFCGAVTDWTRYDSAPAARSESEVGLDFQRANGEDWFRYLAWGRFACIPLSLIGAAVCWKWSRELYRDARCALLAAALWCCDPNLLGWGATITPDVGAAALGALAGFCFWRWLRRGDWPAAIASGLTLGLAELTKMTWIVFIGLFPLLTAFWVATSSRTGDRALSRQALRQLGLQLAAIFLIGGYILNAGYLFEDSFRRLEDFMFVSRSFARGSARSLGGIGGNRFAGTILGRVPVPLPANYLIGIDLQKLDFERNLPQYLNGQWNRGGWWYYYLESLALKEPLGLWGLVLVACATSVFPRRRHGHTAPGTPPGAGAAQHPTRPAAGWRDEVVLLAPALCVLALVSVNHEVSYYRYLLPAFPFVFIWTSKVARHVTWPGWPQRGPARAQVEDGGSPPDQSDFVFATGAHRATSFNGAGLGWVPGVAVCGCFLWLAGSSLSVYPHSLSYFNELAGGPPGGDRYLIDASLDWGQDLYFLKRWQDAHPEAKPLSAALFSVLDPAAFQIDVSPEPPPPAPRSRETEGSGPTPPGVLTGGSSPPGRGRAPGPRPGWYAMSVNRLHDRGGDYAYFLDFLQPTARAGYSISIYHVTAEDANHVRAKLNMPMLSEGDAALR